MDYLLLTKIWPGEVTLLLGLLWHLSTSAVGHSCWVDNCGCYPTMNGTNHNKCSVVSFMYSAGVRVRVNIRVRVRVSVGVSKSL